MPPPDWSWLDDSRLKESADKRKKSAKPERHSVEYKEDGSIHVELDGTLVHTEEELLQQCKINRDEWEVRNLKITAWGVGMKPPAVTEWCKTSKGTTWPAWTRDSSKPVTVQLWSIRADLAPKRIVIAAMAEIEALREKARGYAPKYPSPNAKKWRDQSGNLAEFSIVDHHFGALIWGKETGGADWDLRVARASWESAFSTLVGRTSHLRMDEALLVLGNDQQNADNRQGTTEKGTPQQNDGRHQKVFEVSRDSSIWAIELLMTIAPKVSVLIIPGNHDPLTSWTLGYTLDAWFHRTPNVAVDIAPNGRKYRQHGRVMLMWDHGNHGKLEEYGATMAAEQPRIWGETRWREAHTGDKHHRRLIEMKGATVRILPSLRPPCAWSAENHYVGSIRAAEAYVWNAEEGLISTATYSVLGDLA